MCLLHLYQIVQHHSSYLIRSYRSYLWCSLHSTMQCTMQCACSDCTRCFLVNLYRWEDQRSLSTSMSLIAMPPSYHVGSLLGHCVLPCKLWVVTFTPCVSSGTVPGCVRLTWEALIRWWNCLLFLASSKLPFPVCLTAWLLILKELYAHWFPWSRGDFFGNSSSCLICSRLRSFMLINQSDKTLQVVPGSICHGWGLRGKKTNALVFSFHPLPLTRSKLLLQNKQPFNG